MKLLFPIFTSVVFASILGTLRTQSREIFSAFPSVNETQSLPDV
jgi:hypothetical protein